jgi:hypothetical protein
VSAPGAGASAPARLDNFGGASTDGTRVFFTTDENLVGADTDGYSDVYERSGGTTTLVSAPGAGASGPAKDYTYFVGASADGTQVFFSTTENLVSADTDGLDDVYQRVHATTTLVSTAAPGAGAKVGKATLPDRAAFFEGASADGTRVFFSTTQKLDAADTDAFKDIYERSGGATALVSGPGAGASAGGVPGYATFAGASTDGTRVFFDSPENLVSADTDGPCTSDHCRDLYERSGGTTTLVSAPGAGATGTTPRDAVFGGASADGTRVFFTTPHELVGADADSDASCPFGSCSDVYERSGGTTKLVSAPGAGGIAGETPLNASFAGASANGTRVFFQTPDGLVGTDTDGLHDVYQRSGGATTLVSIPGAGATAPAQGALFAGASADGTRVFFKTDENLIGADTDGLDDVYASVVDETPPETTIDSGPTGATNDFTPTFAFSSEAGATFACRLDAVAFAACSGPGATHTPPLTLGDGDHTFQVRATDVFANTDASPASRAGFTVDTVPPETTITAGPKPRTNDRTPTFKFKSQSGSSFECMLDGKPFAPCQSPKTYKHLGFGKHRLDVRAIDPATNPDPTPAVRKFKIVKH